MFKRKNIIFPKHGFQGSEREGDNPRESYFNKIV